MLNFQFDLNSVSQRLKSLEPLLPPEGYSYITKTLEFIQDTKLQMSLIDTISIMLEDSKIEVEVVRQQLFIHLYKVTEYVRIVVQDQQVRILTAYIDLLYYLLLLILKKIKCNDESSAVLTLYSYFNRSISYLLIHIDDLFKRVKSKDYCYQVQLFSENEFRQIGKNLVLSNFEIIFDCIFLSCKILFSPNNNEICTELNMDINIMSREIKKLFGVIFQYLLVNLKCYQNEIFTKIHSLFTIDQVLTFSYLLLDYVVTKKFTEEADGYDFSTIFPTFYDFTNYFYSMLRMYLVDRVSDYLHIVDNIEGFTLQKFDNYYIPPYLVVCHNTKMKEFLYNHLLSINFNENSYECISRNFWLTIFIDLYSFMDFAERLYRILIECLTTERFKANIVDSVLGVFSDFFVRKFSIVLPRKFLLFKETYTVIYLYLFNYFASSKKFKIYNGSIGYKNTPLLNALEDLSTSWNRKYFLLCNNILKSFKGDSYRKKIRIYQDDSFIIAYNEFIDQKIDFDIQLTNKENTDNNLDFSTPRFKREVSSKFDITGINFSFTLYKGLSISKCKKLKKTYLKIKDLDSSLIILQDSDKKITIEQLTHKSIKEVLYHDIVNKNDFEIIVILATDNLIDEMYANNYKTSLKYYADQLSYDSVVESLMLILEMP
jgi:hypothetical protein